MYKSLYNCNLMSSSRRARLPAQPRSVCGSLCVQPLGGRPGSLMADAPASGGQQQPGDDPVLALENRGAGVGPAPSEEMAVAAAQAHLLLAGGSAGPAAAVAQPATEEEMVAAAVADMLEGQAEAGVKTVLKQLKAQFPDSLVAINTKTTRQMMADFRALKRCSQGHLFAGFEVRPNNSCDECGSIGTARRCGSGCDWDLCAACHSGAPPDAATIAATQVAYAQRRDALIAHAVGLNAVHAQTAKLAKGYAGFFNHVTLRKKWRSVPFVLADVQPYFTAAAPIVVALRGELDVIREGIGLRMLAGSSHELLWAWGESKQAVSTAATSAEEQQALTSALVHETLKDANGYVEGLTESTVNAAIAQHGAARWPWSGGGGEQLQQQAAAAGGGGAILPSSYTGATSSRAMVPVPVTETDTETATADDAPPTSRAMVPVVESGEYEEEDKSAPPRKTYIKDDTRPSTGPPLAAAPTADHGGSDGGSSGGGVGGGGEREFTAAGVLCAD